jgi:hypothetical protein
VVLGFDSLVDWLQWNGFDRVGTAHDLSIRDGQDQAVWVERDLILDTLGEIPLTYGDPMAVSR